MKEYYKIADEQLIRLFREGEVDVVNYLMDKYKNLVRKKSREMYLLGGENEDLIQEGMIGLFKAIMDYDLEQEVSFSHFAELCISRQLYTAIKASNRQKHFPLNSYISLYENDDKSDEQDSGVALIDSLQDEKANNPERLFLDKEYLQGIEEKLKSELSAFENKVLYLHLLGTDYQTIAKLLEKSPKSIDNALQRIKGKMSKIIEEK